MSSFAASEPVQRKRMVQCSKRWERCATNTVATDAAAAAAGRLFSITTREYDELVMAFGGRCTLVDKKRFPCPVSLRRSTTRAQPTCGCPTSAASYDPPNTFSTLEANQSHTLSWTALSASGAVAVLWRLPAPRMAKQALREASLRAQSRYQQIRRHDIPAH